MVHSLDYIEVGDSRGQEDEDEVGCAPGIEDDGGEEQHQIAPFGWHKEIDGQKDWQEIEQEYMAAEYHEVWLCLGVIVADRRGQSIIDANEKNWANKVTERLR